MRRTKPPSPKKRNLAILAGAEKRVRRLLNAISDLHEGDLAKVLELDLITPMEEFLPDDELQLVNGRIDLIPAPGPRPKSLKHRVQTGDRLGRIFEHQLVGILGVGETLPTRMKRRRSTKEIGGRRF